VTFSPNRSMLRLLLIFGIIVSWTPGASAEMSRGFQTLMDAVVRIDVREYAYEAGAKRFRSGVGSGAIVSADGLILTNAHVVGRRAVEINVTLANLERVSAELVGWDHWTDLALLRLDQDELKRKGFKFAVAKFGDSTQLYAGQTVFAVGTPHGLARTVTRGIISNPRRYFADSKGVRGYETGQFNTWLQTDAAINPGNSGGPLVTEDGEIVGINSRGYLGADNLGFAIPSATARAVMLGLEKQGEITRSYIGLVPGALQDFESFYDLALNNGMLINSVDPGSPASEAGLRGGDILLAIDGKRVDGRFPEQLPPIQHMIAEREIGAVLALTVKRGATTEEFTVKTEALVSRVGEESLFEAWGLSVREVSRAYARENQLPDDEGVLVIGVQRGFPAALAGLEVGDVISKVNDTPVNSLEILGETVEAYVQDPKRVLIEARRQFRVSLYILKP
jgi:serine protease Do